jgi:uncharacterized protein (DUF983 family)
MCAHNADHKPSLIWSILTNRCPRCRRGSLFTSSNPYNFRIMMRMPERCEVCGQPFELQTGFYFGTGYVSYGLSLALLALSFIIWYNTIGMSYATDDYRLYYWLGFSTLLLLVTQPLLQRVSRSIWIYFFVRYDANWKSQRLEA